jgi:hypothetical protein
MQAKGLLKTLVILAIVNTATAFGECSTDCLVLVENHCGVWVCSEVVFHALSVQLIEPYLAVRPALNLLHCSKKYGKRSLLPSNQYQMHSLGIAVSICACSDTQ